MKKLIKTLLPLTTGLVVGVVVGRVDKKEKLHADFEKVIADKLDANDLAASNLSD